MARRRGEEEWARQLVEATMGVPVFLHDDGRKPGLFDLRADLPGGRTAAIEVVSAADGQAIELWKLVNSGDRLIMPGLEGGWTAILSLEARAKQLMKALPSLIAVLEGQGVRELHGGCTANDRRAEALGITWLRQGETSFRGSVYFSLDFPSDRSGGWVADHGNALSDWIGPWLAEPSRADVLSKLDTAGAEERHAFVIVPGFTTAPFSVTDLLMRDGAPVPEDVPTLPSPVTHVWAMSTWTSGDGFRWSPSGGWNRFAKQGPIASE